MGAEDVTADEEPLVTLVVADGTQVNHEGTVYEAGQTFEATETEMIPAVAAGWATARPMPAEPAKLAEPAKSRRRARGA